MTALGKNIVEDTRNADKKRQSMLLRGKVMDHAGRLLDISIRNISKFGLSASCKEAFLVQLDGTVTILLSQDVVILGAIRWFEGKMFGVEFLEEFDTTTASAAIQRHVAEAGQWEVRSRHRIANPKPDPVKVRFI